MKQLIACGMALGLLFAAATPAYTQDGDTGPQPESFAAASETDVASQQRIESPSANLDGAVVLHRSWCSNRCAERQYRDILVPGDASEGCTMWLRSQSRCLIKQRAWPSCACVYTHWYGDTDVCIEPA